MLIGILHRLYEIIAGDRLAVVTLQIQCQTFGEAIAAEMRKPAMQQGMIKLGFIPQPRGPAEFGTYLSAEVQRWGKIIKEAGIQTA